MTPCLEKPRTPEPLLSSAVARGNAGVLPQREDRAGGLQAGHEDRPQHPPGALQAAPHPRDT